MRVVGWLLNVLYAALLAVCAPGMLWRMIRHGRYRRGRSEKLWGRLPLRTEDARPLVWFHAVSVGEVLLLRPLLDRLAQVRPEVDVLVSTSTDAGFDVASSQLRNCRVTWSPLDFTWSIGRALRRVRPDLVVLVELELWPNLIHLTSVRGIPLLLINGRLSARSARGYARIRPVMRRLLSKFTSLAVQTPEYARRFEALGAPAERIIVTGSIKFDGVEGSRANPRTAALRALLRIPQDVPVFIAGSTQAPEEAAAMEAWSAARERHPDLRLILVPRHPERFEEVAALVESRGLPLLRRSSCPLPAAVNRTGEAPVILVDSVGELSALWGLADVAYVGGSLTPGRGGQNMLEPAAGGAAVLFGPHTDNFRSAVETLLSAEAAVVVRSAAELTAELRQLLADPASAREMGERARSVVRCQQGATVRTLELVVQQLPGSRASERKSRPAA